MVNESYRGVDFCSLNCCGVLGRRGKMKVYYYCTRCDQFCEIDEELLNGHYWQYVQYVDVDFVDPEDFSVLTEQVSKAAFYIPKKNESNQVYLEELLRNYDLLDPDREYDFEVYMHEVFVRTKAGYPVGHLQRWRLLEEDSDTEDEK